MNNENYLDYMVEEDQELMFEKKQSKYPAVKIISIVLGIIASLCYLYYAIENVYKPYIEQFGLINEYKNSGMMEVTFSIYLPYYVSMILVAALIIAPLVGALLPSKFKSASLVLLMLPVSWQTIDVIPAFLSYMGQGTGIAELYMFLIVITASICALTSAILTLFIKNTCDCDDCMVEFYEYDDSEIEELTSLDGVETFAETASEEEIEEATEEVEELFNEVKEEIEEDIEENENN